MGWCMNRRIKFLGRLAFVISLMTTVSVSGQDSVATPTEAAPPPAPTASGSGLDLNMNLDQLSRQDVVVPGLSTPVTTVERQPSTVGRTPAAVFVITPEMIKRTGARTIPDALRIAPGVDVARINAHSWAISIRGFNGAFANKLLVQIDGRIVYNATFGGVYWNQQDVVLEDVERIEVIRGPGTTMWGSNAVNGVINIITKSSSETQGALVQSGGGGQDQQDFNTARYGGRIGESTTYRVWGQQFDRASGWSADPLNSNDAWHGKHGGFRIDYKPNCEDTLTFQGDAFSGFGGVRYNLATPTPPFSEVFSDVEQFPTSNLLLRYTRVIDDETSWQLMTYYDHYQQMQRDPLVLDQVRDTWNIDYQLQFSPFERHQFVTGANYRRSPDSFVNSFVVGFEPPQFVTEWAGYFLQDTITLEEDRWYFTPGVRLEYNSFGKFQVEPTARLLFLPSERQSVWLAVSRAVRNPTRSDATVYFNSHVGPPGVPVFANITGDPAIEPENMMAYELGYRAAPTDAFTWDIAGYINDYRKLIGVGPIGAPIFQPPGVFLPAMLANNTRALSYGFESTATYQVNECWRLFATYSLFEVNAQSDQPTTATQINGSSPNNMVYLRTAHDLGYNVHWDLIGRYVDSLVAIGVPKYIEMDTRIAWQATKNMEFSFVGQNLLDGHHLEFNDVIAGTIPTEVRRSWYGMLTWTY
jgi:iron complex outermembrane recepter protein